LGKAPIQSTTAPLLILSETPNVLLDDASHAIDDYNTPPLL
jgi:hypothetical protein